MDETKMGSKFLRRIIDADGDHPEDHDQSAFASERQHTAQAFNLHVERRDGRHSEGFAWSHYAGYEWKDEGSHECLTVVFGARAVEIQGTNLSGLVDEIREGKLNRIRELATARKMQLESDNPENEPVIASVKTFPDFEEVLMEIKGEKHEHQTRHARRAER
jgi:hypothetical protein